MSKTNSLRKIIQSNIQTILNCYHRTADADASYPYAVYALEDIDLGDISRDDLILIIDFWDSGTDTSRLEELADKTEALFNAANLPSDEVLPTFYRIGRKAIDDDNKSIIHRQLKFQIQNYEIGG